MRESLNFTWSTVLDGGSIKEASDCLQWFLFLCCAASGLEKQSVDEKTDLPKFAS